MWIFMSSASDIIVSDTSFIVATIQIKNVVSGSVFCT